jgi:hypothetical protein
MLINLYYSQNALSFLNESVFSSLTQQQKKVILIATAAFACLAALYAVRCCWFKATAPSDDRDDDFKTNESPIKPQVEEEEVQPTTEKRIKASGETEEGEFLNGELHGHGKRVFPDGTLYEGEFRNGLLHGIGKKISITATIKEGKPISQDKTIEEGEFRDGKLFKGKMIQCPHGSSVTLFEGEFHNGQLKKGIKKSNGTLVDETFNDRQCTVEEGEFENHELTGQGKKVTPDGFIYEGNFYQGKLHGQGKKTEINKLIEEGEFQNDYFVKGKRLHFGIYKSEEIR